MEEELQTIGGTYIDNPSTLEIPEFTNEEAENREYEEIIDVTEGGK